MFKPNPKPQLLFLAVPERVVALRELLLQATFGASVISTDNLLTDTLSFPQPDLLILQMAPQRQSDLWEKIQIHFAGTPQMIWPPEPPLCLQKLNALLGLTLAEQQLQKKSPSTIGELRQELQGLPRQESNFLLQPLEEAFQIRVQFFGRLKLATSDYQRNVHLARKARKLLVYLLLQRRRIHKENLARLFWVYGGKAALNSLHQSAYLIRKALAKDFELLDFLCYEDNCYFLNPRYQIISDWQELQSYCLKATAAQENSPEQLRYWMEAYRLQSSNFLEGLSHEEEFLIPLRAKSQALRGQVKEALSQYAQELELVGIAALIEERY